MLENSIDERNCQQHVGSERELSRAFPHRTCDRSQYAYVVMICTCSRACVCDRYSLVENFVTSKLTMKITKFGTPRK